MRVFRCEENDTLSSLLDVTDKTLADTLIYITPSAPFCDPAVVGQCLIEHNSSAAEFTALADSSLPDGFSADLVSTRVLKQLDADSRIAGANRENVVAFIRDHTDEFRTHRVSIAIDVSPPNHGVAVSRPEDLEMLCAMHATLKEREWPVDMPHVCKLLDEFSVLNSIIKGLAS